MKAPLFIYGAGGLGREVLSLVNALDTYEVKGFFDDHVKKGTVIKGIEVIGGLHNISSSDQPLNLVLAIGDPLVKKDLAGKLSKFRIHFPVLRHPTALLQEEGSIVIGEGSILGAGCIFTTDIHVGKHVLINLNCTIGHDTRVGDCSSIMPGVNVAGDVIVGDAVLIGSGVNILNGVTIGKECKVGMGAVVIRDVEPGITVAGVPAKRISK